MADDILASLPPSTGWSGGTVKLTVPDEVKTVLEQAQAVGEVLNAYGVLLQTGLSIIQSAIPLYTDPTAAAIDASLEALDNLLTNTSLGAVKLIVISDTPDLATSVLDGRSLEASAAKGAAQAANAQAQAVTAAVLSPTGPSQRAPASVQLQQQVAVGLNTSLSQAQPALLAIRDQLLTSLADRNYRNVPGINGETFGVGLSLVAYGDAGAVDSVIATIKLVRELLDGFKNFAEPPAPPQDLPAPTRLKAVNGSRVKGVNRVLLTWSQNLPKTFPLTANGVQWLPPLQFVQRSFDSVEWWQLDSRNLAAEFPRTGFEYLTSASWADVELDGAVATRINQKLPVGAVRYRVGYTYTAADGTAVATVYGPQVFYTPGSKSAGPSVPPDWYALEASTQLSVLQDAIPAIRAQIASTADQEKKALTELVTIAQKKVAKGQALVAKITAFVTRLNSLFANLGSASVAVRAFDLSGLNLDQSIKLERVSLNSLAQASQSPLTAKLYREYANSLTQLHQYVAPQATVTGFDGGIGVFLVVDSTAASAALELITAVLGLGSSLAATTASVGEQAVGLWESAVATTLNLPPTLEAVAAANANVSLGENESSLNINPAPGTYARPLLGETDYSGADLNCPPK